MNDSINITLVLGVLSMIAYAEKNLKILFLFKCIKFEYRNIDINWINFMMKTKKLA